MASRSRGSDCWRCLAALIAIISLVALVEAGHSAVATRQKSTARRLVRVTLGRRARLFRQVRLVRPGT
jgi:hypothetical protein